MRGTNKELPMFAVSFILLFTRWLLVGKVSMKTVKRKTHKMNLKQAQKFKMNFLKSQHCVISLLTCKLRSFLSGQYLEK